MGGATIQWLRDEMKMIATAAESEGLAKSVKDTGGVYLVPAFTGLGAPWWDMYSQGHADWHDPRHGSRRMWCVRRWNPSPISRPT